MCQKFQAPPLASVLQGNGAEGEPQDTTSSPLPRWCTERLLTGAHTGFQASIYKGLSINEAKTLLTGMLSTSMV